jgi:hypothetical protein
VKEIVCGFRFDGTRSQSPELFQKTVAKIDEQLPIVVDTFQCTAVRMTLWSDDSGWAPTKEFRIPAALLQTRVKKSERNKPQLTDTFKVGRELRAQEEAEAEADREKRIALARADLVRSARKWVADEVRFLDKRCTAVRSFVESLDRLTLTDVRVIDVVVSDFQDTCSPSTLSPVMLRHPVVFVIVPTIGDIHRTASVALETAKVLDQTYVNSESIMAYELATPMVWRELKNRLAAKNLKKDK